MFNIIMMAINITFKVFSLLFKLLATLYQRGLLIPFILLSSGNYLAHMLWIGEIEIGIDIIDVRVLAVVVVVASLALSFPFILHQWKKETPNKELDWGGKKQHEKERNAKSIQTLKPQGIVFGKKGKKWVFKSEDKDGHVLIVGGVGSGKSSCIVIPTLRAWKESVFAIDIKGELYEQTKNHRKDIKVFNPLDNNSYGYNPFYCLRTSENPTQEARAIAQAIVPLPPDTKDPFWIETAQNLFTAAILHFNNQGLSFLDTIMKIQSKAPKMLIQELCESPKREVAYFVNGFIDMDDKILSSIIAELSKNIVPFVTDNNLISVLSRKNNITPDDLEYGNDIYIHIPEHLLRQWKNLLTLIVNQFLTHFEQRSDNNERAILFLLDEFPRLGKVNAMLDGLATLRSKKISMCLIVQSLAQLDTIYGSNERKVISDTCSYKAILGATDADTQEYFSRLVGTYEKSMTSHGTNTDVFGMGRGTSTNRQEMQRRIIEPHEFGMLEDIILLTPFSMPLDMPNINANIGFPMPSNTGANGYGSFCRVKKCPYYMEK